MPSWYLCWLSIRIYYKLYRTSYGGIFYCADCHFDENLFPPLGGDKPILQEWRKITWNESSLSHLDPRTKQSELEVQKIIHLQGLANQLPDAFIDSTKVTKLHIPVANIPTRIEIPTGKLQSSMKNEPKPQLKCGRPSGSKDTIPRKRKSAISMTPEEHITVKPQVDEQVATIEAPVKELSLNDVLVHNNEEISINYIHEGRIWDRNSTHINDVFFLSKWLWTS